jgi:hypothetical protein
MRSPDESGWSQAWRTPLRAALDVLRDRAAALFEDAAGDLFVDPWATRDAYGAVLDASPEERLRFWQSSPAPPAAARRPTCAGACCCWRRSDRRC